MSEAGWAPPTCDEALALWGAAKLNERAKEWGVEGVGDPSSVTVHFDWSEGYACCGGTDPSCYCSMAESPRASLEISSYETRATVSLEARDFDFAAILREVIQAGGGLVQP